MTAVFDYGPLDDAQDEIQGFQVVYSSRLTNSAGGVKEIYCSNGGTLDLETNTITPEGGLDREHAADMESNLLPERSIQSDRVQADEQ